eukprot:4647230-Pyramimonas_sp.AAC.1
MFTEVVVVGTLELAQLTLAYLRLQEGRDRRGLTRITSAASDRTLEASASCNLGRERPLANGAR